MNIQPGRKAPCELWFRGEKISEGTHTHCQKIQRLLNEWYANEKSKLQRKADKQKNELARLTQALEKCAAEKAALLSDIKWLRGEQ